MVGEQVVVGTRYRTGSAVRHASGSVAHLPADLTIEFNQPGAVETGSLVAIGPTPTPPPERKRRRRYADKQRRAGRDYQDKRR